MTISVKIVVLSTLIGNLIAGVVKGLLQIQSIKQSVIVLPHIKGVTITQTLRRGKI
jgi:hypothetical protein